MLSSLEIALWIAGSVAVSLAGLFIAQKFLPARDVRENADFIVATTAIVGTLVAVVLGFMVSSAAEEYRGIEVAVDAQASGLGDVFRLSTGLNQALSAPIQTLCISYCETAISDEWPSLRIGRPSDKLTTTFEQLNAAILNIRPQTFQDSNVQHGLLEALQRIGTARRSILVSVESKWIRELLPMLLICAAVMLCTAYVFVEDKPTRLHSLLIALIATAIGANFGLLLIFGRPFAFGSGISPHQFELNADAMRHYPKL